MALVSLKSSKRTRSSYTIEFKLRVLDHTENESMRKTAAHFGIDESVVHRWKVNSDATKAVHKKSRKHVKHIRLSKYPHLEEAMKSWVLSQRASAFSRVRSRNFIRGKTTGPGSWHPRLERLTEMGCSDPVNRQYVTAQSNSSG